MTLSLLEAIGAIDLVADLDDDIKDSWSSETNRKELIWFYDLLSMIQSKGIRPVILAGDIHTGGVSKLSVDRNFTDKEKVIYQLVSSPISYVPMASLVEKLTSSSFVNEMKLEGKSLFSYNLFYMCKRNFTVITPSSSSNALEADFYFEDLANPENVCIK